MHIGRSTHQHALAAGHGQRLFLAGASDDVDGTVLGGKVNHLAVGTEGLAHARDQVQVHRDIAHGHAQALHAHHADLAGSGRKRRPLQTLSTCLTGLGRGQQQRKAHVLQRQTGGLVIRQRLLLALAIGLAPIGATHTDKGIQTRGAKGQGIGLDLGAIGQHHLARALFKAQGAGDVEKLVDHNRDVTRGTHQRAAAALVVKGTALAAADVHAQGSALVVHHGGAVAAGIDLELERTGLDVNHRQSNFGGGE